MRPWIRRTDKVHSVDRRAWELEIWVKPAVDNVRPLSDVVSFAADGVSLGRDRPVILVATSVALPLHNVVNTATRGQLPHRQRRR